MKIEVLPDMEGIGHAFFTRRGGVSADPFGALNVSFSVGDDVRAVRHNRALAMESFGLDGGRLACLNQVHGADVVVVDAPWNDAEPPAADAMVSSRRGIVLGLQTADCAPVLLCDAKAGVVGAAHAGWRGALSGILENTVSAMCALGASPAGIVAAVGPCIMQESYEVGPGFPKPFLEQDFSNRHFFEGSGNPGHFSFNLSGYVIRRLGLAGVADVLLAPYDTCSRKDMFFSHRRSSQAGERATGRQLSAIFIKPLDSI